MNDFLTHLEDDSSPCQLQEVEVILVCPDSWLMLTSSISSMMSHCWFKVIEKFSRCLTRIPRCLSPCFSQVPRRTTSGVRPFAVCELCCSWICKQKSPTCWRGCRWLQQRKWPNHHALEIEPASKHETPFSGSSKHYDWFCCCSSMYQWVVSYKSLHGVDTYHRRAAGTRP